MDAMKVTALAPWFGSNRMLGAEVGKLLAGCSWVGVPFMGGGAELAHIQARTIVASDVHKHLMNLVSIAAHPSWGPRLYRRLKRFPFHPKVLSEAQQVCEMFETDRVPPGSCALGINYKPRGLFDWATAYFVCCWMGRSGQAGTDGEFRGKTATRWNAAGGDSVVRYRNAVRSLAAWRRVLERVTFECLDCFDFLAKCKDESGHGIYADAPWPSDGDSYRHKFTEAQQRRLADVLAGYRQTRVVVRYGDHELIRSLYPPDRWTWHEFKGRTAANKAKAEVLLTNWGTGTA